jgi:hypothetical protein
VKEIPGVFICTATTNIKGDFIQRAFGLKLTYKWELGIPGGEKVSI